MKHINRKIRQNTLFVPNKSNKLPNYRVVKFWINICRTDVYLLADMS